MKYTVVQFGDGHWEAKVDGESLYHWEKFADPDFCPPVPNRYSTKELAIRAIEKTKATDAKMQALRDKDARDGRVLRIIEI